MLNHYSDPWYDEDPDWSNCAMNPVMFKSIREKCKELVSESFSIDKLLSCILDLFDDYLISEEQESELYLLVDPKDEHNDYFDYWWNDDYENPLLDMARA